MVCYYTPVGKFAAWLRSKILKVKYISLVNLVADKEIVQELVADRMTKENIIQYLRDILPEGKGRQRMMQDYQEMNQRLGGSGASKRAAQAMVKVLKNS